MFTNTDTAVALEQAGPELLARCAEAYGRTNVTVENHKSVRGRAARSSSAPTSALGGGLADPTLGRVDQRNALDPEVACCAVLHAQQHDCKAEWNRRWLVSAPRSSLRGPKLISKRRQGTCSQFRILQCALCNFSHKALSLL